MSTRTTMQNNIIEELLENDVATARSYQPGRIKAMEQLAVLFAGAVQLTYAELEDVPGSSEATLTAVKDSAA